MLYTALILIFLMVWLLAGTLLVAVFGKRKPIKRLELIDEEPLHKDKEKEVQKQRNNIVKVLSGLVPKNISKNKRNKKLELELAKADLPINPEELLIIKLLSATAVSFIVYAISKSIFFALLVFVIIWIIPGFIIEKKRKDRIKLFDSQLGEGITIISNSLKAGYSFLQAVAVVSEKTSDPFSKEFKILLKEMSLGISEEEALRKLINRMESEDLKLIINAILIQKDIGGNLSEILDNISETISERQKIQNELKTLTAQGKLSGFVLTLFPVFLGLVIFLFNREYILLLFQTTIGLCMVGVALASEFLGYLMIRKIIKIDM